MRHAYTRIIIGIIMVIVSVIVFVKNSDKSAVIYLAAGAAFVYSGVTLIKKGTGKGNE